VPVREGHGPRQVERAMEDATASTTIYEAVKASHELPSPTGVALEILRLTHDEESTIDEITAVVESDPALASRILKMVNASLAGLPRQVASVQRAVSMLGVRTVSHLALGFSLVAENQSGQCEAFNYASFWSESVARGAASRHITYFIGGFAPDEAFTCGLLCQLGRLALATAFPKAYADTLFTVGTANLKELAEAERAVFDIDHNELTAEMMADWHIPILFCDAARMQDIKQEDEFAGRSRTAQFARVLHLSGAVARVLTGTTADRDALSGLVLEANSMGITPEVYHEVFDAINREWRELGEILSVRTRIVPPSVELYTQAQRQRDTLDLGEVKTGES
jgi:two-component system cell cycle response regulator